MQIPDSPQAIADYVMAGINYREEAESLLPYLFLPKPVADSKYPPAIPSSANKQSFLRGIQIRIDKEYHEGRLETSGRELEYAIRSGMEETFVYDERSLWNRVTQNAVVIKVRASDICKTSGQLELLARKHGVERWKTLVVDSLGWFNMVTYERPNSILQFSHRMAGAFLPLGTFDGRPIVSDTYRPRRCQSTPSRTLIVAPDLGWMRRHYTPEPKIYDNGDHYIMEWYRGLEVVPFDEKCLIIQFQEENPYVYKE